MQVISVRGLRKSFHVKQKAAGLGGSFTSLFRPTSHTVDAVSGISFDMEPGELLGFIGPNGAGKSTTIKILTGILHPSGGEVHVLGLTPWRERRALAYRIGSVFGQRPQLWYHLPALDTFYLFGKIYELDDATVRQRVKLLAEAFEIEELLQTPVRKLSLGQRMRCEVAASLLHRPQLLLLDEPSIGLDVVAKQRIRDTIRQMNEQEGVGVLLTSHDAGDIEALCRRVIIVNHGQIIFQDKVSSLKRRYLTSKTVEARYAEALPETVHVAGAELLKAGQYGLKLRFDSRETPVESLLARLATLGSLVDLTIADPSLEEVIRAIYEEAAPVQA
ncbi:MAG: ATP-binding cassette domain-containing protein [Chloroflexaceae bacterium]|jgi:ABC-2 type transport system ATP-binding protein|nr:ATP-binding cassette domain-containing protein [Chloroflexaceae bacterium]